MNTLEIVKAFYQNGTDPVFSPNPNHIFLKQPVAGERVVLVPGHFYTFQELIPVSPDQVPTVDEYEMMKYPGKSEAELLLRYKVKKPYYDNRPIFLALSQDGFGIDVKLMHPLLRKRFIRTYLTRIQTQLAKCFNPDGELLPFRTRLGMSELTPIFTIKLDFIQAISGIPELRFGLLVNKYNRETMRNLTMIDWDDVPKLHMADYSTDRTISTRSSFSLLQIK